MSTYFLRCKRLQRSTDKVKRPHFLPTEIYLNHEVLKRLYSGTTTS